jgi:hypothetical protein
LAALTWYLSGINFRPLPGDNTPITHRKPYR